MKGAGDSLRTGELGRQPREQDQGVVARDRALVLRRQLVQSRELPDVRGHCGIGGEREQRLRQCADWLAGAYPCPGTRPQQQQAAGEWAAYRRWTLRPGQLVIIDEASMAAAKDLDHITAVAPGPGAKVLLVGTGRSCPWCTGGAYRLLADERGADVATLHEVRCLQHQSGRKATPQRCAGNPEVANTYLEHGRAESGTREDVLTCSPTPGTPTRAPVGSRW